ncbi:MAG: hypothetical protein Fur0044_46340 [Anaerolineae bacterium]
MTPSSGSVHAQGNLTARDIITGLKIDKVEIVLTSLDDLARLAGRSEVKFKPHPDGGLELLGGNGQSLLALPSNLVQAFRQLPQAADLSLDHRYRCYAAWLLAYQPLNPPAAVAARDWYIPLTGHLSWDWDDEGLQGHLCELTWVGDGPQRQLKRERLADVTEAIHKHPAFVLLGAPGSGKSTVLRRLVRTAAQAYLAGHSPRLPLFLELGSYHWERHTPLDFAQAEWAAQVAADFVSLARQGRLLLLADGLNEMPYLPPQPASERADDWRRFVAQFFAEAAPGSSRALLASRDQGDYEQPLGLPRVEIEPLQPEQIEHFAAIRLGSQAAPFLKAVERLDLWPLARVPISLFFLTQLFQPASGDLPANKGQLFKAYATLLWQQLYPKASNSEREAHLTALAELGYAMQERGESTILPAADILALLPPQVRLPKQPRPAETPPELVFERAWRSGLFSQVNEQSDTYKFSHQLLQEHFAARAVLTRWREHNPALAELWRAPRTPAEMPTPGGGEWDALPPPLPSRWEQAAILAAGMTDRPDAWVQAVLAVNPALAGRCLAEGGAEVGPETRAAVAVALLADLTNPALHRRARLQAGRTLAVVGDPRLQPVDSNGVQFILPDLLPVPGGTATLGSAAAEAFGDEQPVHPVEIAPFYLARCPVTNAEYRCFMLAGGYTTERYWTPTGWQWRSGQLAESGPVEDMLERRQYVLDNPGLLEQLVQEGRMRPQERDAWQTLVSMSDEAARRQVSAWYPAKVHEQPYYWDDPAYNGDNQPVVGVTWYEAMAYCEWLNEQVSAEARRRGGEEVNGGRPSAVGGLPDEVIAELAAGTWQLRLPTEAEWEWAAGGPAHLPYPWGSEFDPDQANTLEGRVLGTSPVGAYPAGAAPCGALDMAGNVWEWTHSLYRPYPYRLDDGREDPLAGGQRTLRGGAWNFTQRLARVSSRTRALPDDFDNNIGFRVVVAPILS